MKEILKVVSASLLTALTLKSGRYDNRTIGLAAFIAAIVSLEKIVEEQNDDRRCTR